jgi:hypothetical protein
LEIRPTGSLKIKSEEKTMTFKTPRPIAIFVTIVAKGSPPYTARIATADNESDIPRLIAEDKRAMGDTFGGLIEAASTKGRSYRAFRAVWTEIPIV